MSGKKSTEKVNFFAAIKAGCTADGATFARMSLQRSRRVFFHLLLLSLILGLAAGSIKYFRHRGQIIEGATVIADKLGKITFAGNGLNFKIIPERKVERNFAVALLEDLAVIYFDPQSGDKVNTFTPPEQSRAVVLMPELAIQLFEAPDGMYLAGNTGGVNQVSATGLTDYLISLNEAAKNSTENDQLLYQEFAIEPGILPEFTSAVFYFSWTIGEFISFFLVSLFYVTMLCLFLFWTRPGRHKITFGKFWNTGIYAAFPGLIVGAFFPAFELPLLSFNMILVIVLVIYLPFISVKLEKKSE